MVAALVLETSGEIRVSSSLTIRTKPRPNTWRIIGQVVCL